MNSSREYPRKPDLAALLLASVGALPIAPAYSHLMHIHSHPMKHTMTASLIRHPVYLQLNRLQNVNFVFCISSLAAHLFADQTQAIEERNHRDDKPACIQSRTNSA